jgi:hypothetical protein
MNKILKNTFDIHFCNVCGEHTTLLFLCPCCWDVDLVTCLINNFTKNISIEHDLFSSSIKNILSNDSIEIEVIGDILRDHRKKLFSNSHLFETITRYNFNSCLLDLLSDKKITCIFNHGHQVLNISFLNKSKNTKTYVFLSHKIISLRSLSHILTNIKYSFLNNDHNRVFNFKPHDVIKNIYAIYNTFLLFHEIVYFTHEQELGNSGSKVDYMIVIKNNDIFFPFVIEIDGKDHIKDKNKLFSDIYRDCFCMLCGFSIIRIQNHENIESIITKALTNASFPLYRFYNTFQERCNSFNEKNIKYNIKTHKNLEIKKQNLEIEKKNKKIIKKISKQIKNNTYYKCT